MPSLLKNKLVQTVIHFKMRN